MNEKIGLFLKKLGEDSALLEKLAGAANLDEAFAIASKVLEGLTKEDFAPILQTIKEKLDSDEVSDDALAGTAGGMSFPNPFARPDITPKPGQPINLDPTIR